MILGSLVIWPDMIVIYSLSSDVKRVTCSVSKVKVGSTWFGFGVSLQARITL